MLDLLFVLMFAASPVLTAVVTERTKLCRVNDFVCDDGTCVNMDLLCLDRSVCPDGSDAKFCSRNQIAFGQPVLTRTKRQSTKCRKHQWKCRDGTCISFDGKCDGVVDCPDGSDETHPLCRGIQCQSNWFRCTYGACVDGTALCNNIQECADNSDELNPKCLNTTDQVQGRFKCQNGELIPSTSRCDGVPDCSDGSDETIRACATENCPSYLFQCAYGACVDQGSDCNGKNECADGSDESDELCNRIGTGTTAPPTAKPSTGACVLPSFPDHGGYVVSGVPNPTPGQRFEVVNLNVTCNPGYGVQGQDVLYCINGIWSEKIPQCIRLCKLTPHPSVEYICIINTEDRQESRKCREYEPSGTIVSPKCRTPNYYYAGVLSFMRCIEGSWDHIAICTPGLPKNGTNISIIIKDNVEVHVNAFQYAVPNDPNDRSPIIYPSSTSKVSHSTINSPVIPTVSPVKDNSLEYEINEDDWRIGPGTTRKPANTSDSIKIFIQNSTVIVNANDKIYFRD